MALFSSFSIAPISCL
jgi:translation initiation factor IF-3